MSAAAAFGQLASCSGGDEEHVESSTPTGARGAASRPANVVVIMADDMRYDEAQFMPNMLRLVARDGASFTAARHNISLCSPARAGFLSGQYSRRHGVRSQHDSFRGNHDETKTIAVWMHDAGYDTGVIGKYFTPGEASTSPPGWNLRRQLTNDNQLQFGFSVWDGAQVTTPDVDQTRYLRDEVVAFLRVAREPFFLWFTPTANHWPYEAPPAYEHAADSLVWPDRREVDVSDKPPWIQSLPEVTDQELDVIRREQRLRVSELVGLDDTIAHMFDVLEERGSLANTLVMFSSDNGILRGEHRLRGLKNMPYEPSVRVPCFVRGPGVPIAELSQPVQMAIDLTATCVDVAGARPDLALDGVSLLEVVAKPERFDDRKLLYDRDQRDDGQQITCPPADGIFTKARKLVRYASAPPIYELYDLESDPDELDNVADDPRYAEERRDLEAELDEMLGN